MVPSWLREEEKDETIKMNGGREGECLFLHKVFVSVERNTFESLMSKKHKNKR